MKRCSYLESSNQVCTSSVLSTGVDRPTLVPVGSALQGWVSDESLRALAESLVVADGALGVDPAGPRGRARVDALGPEANFVHGTLVVGDALGLQTTACPDVPEEPFGAQADRQVSGGLADGVGSA